jgi:predicted  nucleic acid-binding Zn-ribbon protein
VYLWGLFRERETFETRVNQLRSQVENLEATKNNLQVIEAEFITKQTEFNTLNSKVEELRHQSQELEKKAAELELLRATYDGLFRERESFEIRVNQLRPEIENLEAEKKRILQAIQENVLEYNRIEEYRQRLADLDLQIRDKSALVRTRERKIDRLNGQKAALEENIPQLEQRLKELKGEIEEIENSANIALKSLKEELWNQLPQTQLNFSNETEFLTGFIQYLQSEGLNFSQRVIKAFHTSLKVQDISALVILAGISGTGKSQLPQRYAEYMGAQLLTLPVQPRWDSPQDLQGFYNYVEKKYKPTDLMRGLYQYSKDSNMQGRIVIVLLDEMNLARVEYYFSDFLSKLEIRRHRETYLDIDLGSLALSQSEKQLKIPNEFLFVGTMNEDETTQSLSDKVLDRANVLTFGKPQNLQLLQEHQQTSKNGKHSGYLPYSDFENWIKKPNPNSDVVERVKDILNQTNNVMEQIGHPFAHRVYQAITQYVVNYPGVEDSNSEVFKFAIADQFGQKLLPKLRGVMVDEMQNELAELKGIIQEIGDNSLIVAFEKARKGRYGQFHWQGLVYQQEEG